MMDLDFEPAKVKNGVFVTKARVVPDVKGMFYLSIMNVSESDVRINGRKVLGHVNETGETLGSLSADCANNIETAELSESHLAGAKFGKNLSVDEKSKLVDLIHKHANVFARNPKKPSQTSVVHPIITEGAPPVKSRY